MNALVTATFLLLLQRGFADSLQASKRVLYREPDSVPVHAFGGHIFVANRAGGSVTGIDPETLAIVAQYQLPDDGEPMYFGWSRDPPELWVGDRRNNRLVILKLSGRKLIPDGFLDTPAGLFHTMNTQDGNVKYPIVWNTCDIANVTVVYDLTTRRKLAEIPRPPIVAELGGVPHDVTANKDYGFVTYIKNSDGAGYVASYDARTFELVKVIKVLFDPHVAIRGSTKLAVAAQGGEVLLLSIPNLEQLESDREQPSPHGTIISLDLKYLYVTNIAEEGENALVSYSISTLRRLNCPSITTSNPIPHNPKTTLDGSKIFITHSGSTSDVCSAFNIGKDGCPLPATEKIIRTGLNPFGICVLPRSVTRPVCRVRRRLRFRLW
ncbi:hypothetical protein BWQ96_05302 [Gracilariopsis chorda]|uniref:Uncharacterized protein n=1 Tax=Gracilariopsis chorda TaxID=448386 RepID=A0A2V3IS35_9FLOR|nr:hypothetical protein BWQ96_05302 [Gracilariopsis chorda]|eukprot:PXF44938.1 hypothetical protein BWQ96_05302 [Gracilariopsis chorda]